MTNRSNAAERRQYLRIDAGSLRLSYEIVPPEILEETREWVLAQEPSLEELEIETDKLFRGTDPMERLAEEISDLRRHMSALDAKLDYLIALAEGGETAASQSHLVSMIDISGAGLSFGCSERIPENSPLKIRLQLSRFPHSEIITLARVVWTRPAESSTGRDTYEVGVFFDTILKDDREKIFRHIARIERKMLRERKETRDA